MEVGIRQLKAHLSEYVATASEGAEIVVTDRGRPVARLAPLRARSDVERGIDEGWIEPSRRARLSDVRPVRSDRSTTEVLAEDRG